MSVRLESLLRPFDGESSWNDWFDKFTTVSELEEWNESIKLKMLIFHLGAVPSKVVKAIPPKDRSVSVINARLRDMYRPDEGKAHMTMVNRKLKAGETPEELWYDLVGLWRCATNQSETTVNETIEYYAVLPFFYEALPKRVTTVLRSRIPQDLSVLFPLARTFLASEREEEERTIGAIGGQQHLHRSNAPRCTKCGIYHFGECGKTGIRCRKCGLCGHIAKYCRNMGKVTGEGLQTLQRNATPSQRTQ